MKPSNINDETSKLLNGVRMEDMTIRKERFPNASRLLSIEERNDRPIFINHTNLPNGKWVGLHDMLADVVIEFFRENINDIPNDTDSISFSFDGILESAKAGEWIPYSDSAMYVFGRHKGTYESRVIVDSK